MNFIFELIYIHVIECRITSSEHNHILCIQYVFILSPAEKMQLLHVILKTVRFLELY